MVPFTGSRAWFRYRDRFAFRGEAYEKSGDLALDLHKSHRASYIGAL